MVFYIMNRLTYSKSSVMLMIIFIFVRMLVIKIYLSLALTKPFLDYPAMSCIFTYNLYKSLRFPDYFKICPIYQAFFFLCKHITPLILFLVKL